MDAEPNWIDGFLFWDAVLVAALVFADWLLGEEKRAAMREKAGDWWLHVQEISFAGLVGEYARKVRKGLQRIVGKKNGLGFDLFFVLSLSASH